jgi:hypothetical protein
MAGQDYVLGSHLTNVRPDGLFVAIDSDTGSSRIEDGFRAAGRVAAR